MNKKFTDQQFKAVKSTPGKFVVKAGAGTGKTRVLVNKYINIYENNLEKNISAQELCSSILTVTFTKRAASEMKERLSNEISEDVLRSAQISTIDGFCSRFIKENSFRVGIDPEFRVLDAVESNLFFRKVGLNILENKIDWSLDIDESREDFLADAFALINKLKQRLITPKDFKSNKKNNPNIHRAIYALYKNYETKLSENNFMDFGKLLTTTYSIIKSDNRIKKEIQEKYKYILVDEYQDTNPAQVNLLKVIAQPQNNYFAVGDEQQSIYGFRGARPQHIMDYYSELPDNRKVVLTRNFRSQEPIPQVINTVFEEELTSYHPIECSIPGKGNVELFLGEDRKKEAEFVALRVKKLLSEGYNPQDIVVLFRGVKNCQDYEEALRNLNINSVTIGGTGFYKQPEIKDLISFIILIENPFSERELVRILRSPAFGVKDSEIAKIAGANGKDRNLFENLKNSNLEAAERLVNLIRYFRSERNSTDIVTLLNELLEKSGLIYWALSRPGGKSSREMTNIKKFISKARSYAQKNVFTTLIDYAHHLRKIEQAQIGEPEARPQVEEVVHLMSIHQAKGLEFPVVFVSNISRANFPGQKKMDRYHFNKKLGLVIRDNDRNSLYSTYLKPRLYKNHNQEERRLLYVALTRAQEKLIITGQKNFRGKISKFMNYFLTKKEKKFELKNGLKKNITRIKKNPKLDRRKDSGIISKSKKELKKTMKSRDIKKYINNLGLPVYFKNREVKKEFSVTELETYSNCPLLYKFRYKHRVPKPPGKGEFSPTLFGSSVHRMLEEYVKLKNFESRLEMEEKIRELILKSGIKKNIYQKFYKKKVKNAVENIYKSGILNSKKDIIYSEKPFVLKYNNCYIKGTVDRVDNVSGSTVLIDYKTSSTAHTAPYKLQLSIYTKALKEVFNLKNIKCKLYFVNLNKLVLVNKIRFLNRRLNSLIKGIQYEKFPSRKGKSCRYCPYRKLCNLSIEK
ncbi:MAG: ATP-dependent helicase [Elusimicrobiota bacterium]